MGWGQSEDLGDILGMKTGHGNHDELAEKCGGQGKKSWEWIRSCMRHEEEPDLITIFLQ